MILYYVFLFVQRCDASWNTCIMINTVPQLQWQNNLIWKGLEKNCTDWADKHNKVWVICGPVFFNKNPSVWLGQQNEKRVAVQMPYSK